MDGKTLSISIETRVGVMRKIRGKGEREVFGHDLCNGSGFINEMKEYW